MKNYLWNVEGTDGVNHAVTLDTDFRANRFDITVDGTPFPVQPSRRHYFLGFAKHTLSVGGKTCHLLARGTQADLAVDGKFLGCGLPYVPYPPIPKFLSFYLILCALACVMGGIPSWIVGILATARCGRAATSPFLTKDAKRKICGTTTALAWALSLAAALLMYFLQR